MAGYTESRLNFSDLVRGSTTLRGESARYVKIIDKKAGYLSNGNVYLASSSYSTHVYYPDGKLRVNEEPQKYVSVAEFTEPYMRVKVGCSCPDFKYRQDWALWKSRGASDLEYSTDQFPTIRNPHLRIYCCKHLIALYNSSAVAIRKIESQARDPAWREGRQQQQDPGLIPKSVNPGRVSRGPAARKSRKSKTSRRS